MKRVFRLSSEGSTLLVALVAALAVHGLVIAYLQLRRTKTEGSVPLTIRDNTPELLRFASQPAPLTNVDVLPLPKARVLPPPPSALLSPLRPVPQAGGLGGTRPSTSSTAKRQARVGRKPQRATGNKTLPSPTVPTERTVTSLPVSSRPPADLDQAIKILQAAQRADGSPRQGLSTIPANRSGKQEEGIAQSSGVNPGEANQQEAYQALWNAARPISKLSRSNSSAEGVEGEMEIRQLPLAQTQGKDLDIRHGRVVPLPGSVLLFWLDDKTLWLLRSPRYSSPPA